MVQSKLLLIAAIYNFSQTRKPLMKYQLKSIVVHASEKFINLIFHLVLMNIIIQGHHIITVKQLENTINEKLIGSADDIVFLTSEDHLAVHMGNFSNPTNMDVLVKLRPGFAETIQKMEKMVA